MLQLPPGTGNLYQMDLKESKADILLLLNQQNGLLLHRKPRLFIQNAQVDEKQNKAK